MKNRLGVRVLRPRSVARETSWLEVRVQQAIREKPSSSTSSSGSVEIERRARKQLQRRLAPTRSIGKAIEGFDVHPAQSSPGSVLVRAVSRDLASQAPSSPRSAGRTSRDTAAVTRCNDSWPTSQHCRAMRRHFIRARFDVVGFSRAAERQLCARRSTTSRCSR